MIRMLLTHLGVNVVHNWLRLHLKLMAVIIGVFSAGIIIFFSFVIAVLITWFTWKYIYRIHNGRKE